MAPGTLLVPSGSYSCDDSAWCTRNWFFFVCVIIVYVMAWVSFYHLKGHVVSVSPEYCQHVTYKLSLITLWVGFVVSEFQLRELFHKHQIYAPELDPHHDMHIHHHLQHPIYTICNVFGFGQKFLGSYESGLDNFVEVQCQSGRSDHCHRLNADCFLQTHFSPFFFKNTCKII